MKANELREMQTAELTSKLADLKAELFNLRFHISYIIIPSVAADLLSLPQAVKMPLSLVPR